MVRRDPLPNSSESPDEQKAPRQPPQRGRASARILDAKPRASHAATDEVLGAGVRAAERRRSRALARIVAASGLLPTLEARKFVPFARGLGDRRCHDGAARRAAPGETLRPVQRRRPAKPRRLRCFVDVSGSSRRIR